MLFLGFFLVIKSRKQYFSDIVGVPLLWNSDFVLLPVSPFFSSHFS